MVGEVGRVGLDEDDDDAGLGSDDRDDGGLSDDNDDKVELGDVGLNCKRLVGVEIGLEEWLLDRWVASSINKWFSEAIQK